MADSVDLLIQSGWIIYAIGLDGWRIDVGYPEDREEVEKRFKEKCATTGDDWLGVPDELVIPLLDLWILFSELHQLMKDPGINPKQIYRMNHLLDWMIFIQRI